MGWQYDQCQGVMLAPKPLPRNLYIAREYTHVWKFARSRVCRKSYEYVYACVCMHGVCLRSRKRGGTRRERGGRMKRARRINARVWTGYFELSRTRGIIRRTRRVFRVSLASSPARLLTTTTTISSPLICTRIRRIVPRNNISR